MNIQKNTLPVKDLESVNDLLFDSLEAKLSLLNGYKETEMHNDE